ncbi:MAG: hypothetical protein AB8I58_00785, partial [Anaerolineales bacterium]
TNPQGPIDSAGRRKHHIPQKIRVHPRLSVVPSRKKINPKNRAISRRFVTRNTQNTNIIINK